MRAFGEDRFTLLEQRVHHVFAVDEAETLEVFDPGKPLFFVVADVVREIVLFEQFDVFLLEAPVTFLEFARDDVPDAQAVAARFIHIGRADAFERRTDFRLAFRGFRRRIDDAVSRQDQVRFFRDQQLALYVDAVFLQFGDLFGENHRIDHHAVADDIDRAFAENTRRDRVQYVFFAFKME